jgi:hypothetical protein
MIESDSCVHSALRYLTLLVRFKENAANDEVVVVVVVVVFRQLR